MKRMTAVALALMLSACGGGGANSPSNVNNIPNVAGTYDGPITWTVDGTVVATFAGRMIVAQAGSQLTITGTLTFEGETFPLTAITGNINATGFFTATSGGPSAITDPDCGTIRGIDTSLTFSGRNASYVEHDSTQFCGNWTFAGTLTR